MFFSSSVVLSFIRERFLLSVPGFKWDSLQPSEKQLKLDTSAFDGTSVRLHTLAVVSFIHGVLVVVFSRAFSRSSPSLLP